jgi:6-phosphogluconolactonase (cycloisomerase 2 family)
MGNISTRGWIGFLPALIAIAVAVGSLVLAPASARALDNAGAVFTISNDPGGNSVLIFDRAADGTLTAAGQVSTGGRGSGDGLGSQGAIILNEGGRFLFAVNAGSNEISSFRVREQGLTLIGRVNSGGTRPISITVENDLLYVLNAGLDGNITGFEVSPDGELSQIAGSTRPLSSGTADPAQVQFSPDGRLLVVTEKGTNLISTYVVDADGLATGPNAQPSAGVTPFGFAFDRQGRLFVSEAFGGGADASAASSYNVASSGDLTPITASAGTTETSACWLVVTDNGKFAYVANTGSGTISGYRIGADGSLTLLDADGVTGMTGAGTAPADSALSAGSQYLYTRNGGTDSIIIFDVEADGSLTEVGTVTGLPDAFVGLAAR